MAGASVSILYGHFLRTIDTVPRAVLRNEMAVIKVAVLTEVNFSEVSMVNTKRKSRYQWKEKLLISTVVKQVVTEGWPQIVIMESKPFIYYAQ